MYQKVDTDLNFVQREKQVEQFWKENHIFEKSMENRKEGPTYTFYDGPPTANGKPHIGHVLTRVIKDMIPRYRTMKGYMVPRKAGWDTHGLPVCTADIGLTPENRDEAVWKLAEEVYVNRWDVSNVPQHMSPAILANAMFYLDAYAADHA